MSSVSIFPQLLTYWMVGPLLLRLVLAGVFFYFGYHKSMSPQSKWSKSLGVIEIILAILLLAGLFTQVASLLVAVILVVQLVDKVRSKNFLTSGVNYFLILLVIAISLVFTGPGFLAFDLPL